MNTNKRHDESFIGVTTDIEEAVYKGHEGMPKQQDCRSILVSLVVEGSPSAFVSIRVHSWFVFINDHLFYHSNDSPCRMRHRPGHTG